AAPPFNRGHSLWRSDPACAPPTSWGPQPYGPFQRLQFGKIPRGGPHTLYRDERGPRSGGHRLARAFLERDVAREDDRGRAHALVGRIERGRHLAAVAQGNRSVDEALARGDDSGVARAQPLLGAILDRPHALLRRLVLNRDPDDPAERLLFFLRLAVDEVVVRPVRARNVRPRDVDRDVSAAVFQARTQLVGNGLVGRIVHADHPAVLVVDRD